MVKRTIVAVVYTALTLAFIVAVSSCDSPPEAEPVTAPPPTSNVAAIAELAPDRPVPPTLVDAYFPNSRFGECGEPIMLCGVAAANDDSPIEFQWSVLGDLSGETIFAIAHSELDAEELTECIEVTPISDQTLIEVRAVRNDGVPGPDGESSMQLYDSLTIPIYATGPGCDSD